MSTLTHTYTRTGNVMEFADPYKICEDCGGWVTGAIDIPGEKLLVTPCEHDRGYRSVCPSWGPVDGCSCREHLGHVPHGEPPTREGR